VQPVGPTPALAGAAIAASASGVGRSNGGGSVPRLEENRWVGLCLGVVGGAAGLAAMSGYWKIVSLLSPDNPANHEPKREPGPLDSIALFGSPRREGEPSTEAAGRIAYRLVTGVEPRSRETLEALSTAAHYGFGLVMGGIFGALRGPADPPDPVAGLAFGAALWLGAHEVVVPLVGLGDGPTAEPIAMHAHELGGHLAYGLATAAVTQALRRLLLRGRR
jgi:hypothetical protein